MSFWKPLYLTFYDDLYIIIFQILIFLPGLKKVICTKDFKDAMLYDIDINRILFGPMKGSFKITVELPFFYMYYFDWRCLGASAKKHFNLKASATKSSTSLYPQFPVGKFCNRIRRLWKKKRIISIKTHDKFNLYRSSFVDRLVTHTWKSRSSWIRFEYFIRNAAQT